MAQGWTFLTNHAHVLICLSRDPEMLMRDVATAVGITEGAVRRIVAELDAADYLTRTRKGRRNVYEVDLGRPLRHPLEREHTIGELLSLMAEA
jgi:DNA-binding MarR family transcriptional regulator